MLHNSQFRGAEFKVRFAPPFFDRHLSCPINILQIICPQMPLKVENIHSCKSLNFPFFGFLKG